MAEADPERKLIRGEDYEYPRKEKIRELSPEQKRILKMISVAIVVILISYGIYYLLAPEWFYGKELTKWTRPVLVDWNNTTDTFIFSAPTEDIDFSNTSYAKTYAINVSENNHINITLAFAPIFYEYSPYDEDLFAGYVYFSSKIKDGGYSIKSIIVGWDAKPSKYILLDINYELPYFAGNVKYNLKSYMYNLYNKHMAELYPDTNFTYCWGKAFFGFSVYGNERHNWTYNITIPYIFEYTLTVYYGKSFMGFWYDVHSISTKVFVKILPSERNTLLQHILG